MRQRLAAHGSAPGEEIWDRYVRPQRWPEWSPQIVRVSYPFDTIRPDSQGVVHGPVGLRVNFTVDEVDAAARRWTWRVSLGPIRLQLEHLVSAGGTELIVDGPAPIVLGYLPLAQLALLRLVRI